MRDVDLRIAQTRLLFESRNDTGRRQNTEQDFLWLLQQVSAAKLRLRHFHVDEATLELAAGGVVKIDYGNESHAHRLMKSAMRIWLQEHGGSDAIVEYTSHGFRFDVASPSLACYVECGNTAIRKLQALIEDRSGPRFIMVPYQPGIGVRSRSIVAIEFVWGRELTLQLMAEKVRAQAADVMAWANKIGLECPPLVPESHSSSPMMGR